MVEVQSRTSGPRVRVRGSSGSAGVASGSASSVSSGASGPQGGVSVRGPLSAPAKAVNLLRRADGLLSEAAGASDPAERFCTAYVGALRGAAAVLAAGEGTSAGGTRRPRSRSAWVLMARAEPGFGAWADYFAGYSGLRADLEAGITRTIGAEEVDGFYAEVGRFLFDVEDLLGR